LLLKAQAALNISGTVHPTADRHRPMPPRGECRMRVFNMKVTPTLLICSALLMLCSNFAPQEAKAQGTAVSPLVDDPSPKPVQKPSEAKPMSTNCYTNENNCAGYTTIGGFRYTVECSIWWNNGANGRSTMTFETGQSKDYYVRYNDVGSCIATQYAPPPNSPTFYLYVHKGLNLQN
jgi:hypothetical protein